MLLTEKELRLNHLGWFGAIWAVFASSMFGYCSGVSQALPARTQLGSCRLTANRFDIRHRARSVLSASQDKRGRSDDHRHRPQSEQHELPGAHFFPLTPRERENQHRSE